MQDLQVQVIAGLLHRFLQLTSAPTLSVHAEDPAGDSDHLFGQRGGVMVQEDALVNVGDQQTWLPGRSRCQGVGEGAPPTPLKWAEKRGFRVCWHVGAMGVCAVILSFFRRRSVGGRPFPFLPTTGAVLRNNLLCMLLCWV